MEYKLLNRGDIIQQGDEWYDESYDYGVGRWNPCQAGSYGIKCDSGIYRRPVEPWQDITTAPKDGTAILVGWWDGWKHWQCTVVTWENPYCYGDRKDWNLVSTGSQAEDCVLEEEPTHWQPLPEPPIKEEQP